MCRDTRELARPGCTLVEGMVVLTVFAIIVAGATATFVAGSKLEREAADRAEVLATISTAAAILSWEVRTTDTRRDGFQAAADSLAQRVFRGRVIVCSADSTRANVRYVGLRTPDPSKDSLLVLAGRGPERAIQLSAAAAGGTACQPRPGETLLTIEPGAGLATGDIALLFERGSYHLASGALRYRRGAGGRQPLTSSALFDDSTDLTLAIRTPPVLPAETVAIRFRLSTVAPARPGMATPPEVLRIPLLNLKSPLDSLTFQP